MRARNTTTPASLTEGWLKLLKTALEGLPGGTSLKFATVCHDICDDSADAGRDAMTVLTPVRTNIDASSVDVNRCLKIICELIIGPPVWAERGPHSKGKHPTTTSKGS